MNTKKNRIIFAVVILCLAASVGSFAVLWTAESKVRVAEIPPVQETVIDVVKYDSDLIKVTSNWPIDFTVENISDKDISGFELMIVTPNEEGGPVEAIWWGTDPNYAKQTPLFKRNETVSLPIRPQAVKKFQDIGASFLYVQVSQLFVNNDPKFKYSFGALFQQDENNWRVYHVIVDSKGKSKAHHNHALPHITHSVKPPFVAPCCNREVLDSTSFDCEITDTCDPLERKCRITNLAFTICGGCGCPNRRGFGAQSCSTSGAGTLCPPHLCDQSKPVAYNLPCQCCGC